MAGYRLPSIPGGCEVRVRFCEEFRTARRGFDSRRLHTQKPGNPEGLLGFSLPSPPDTGSFVRPCPEEKHGERAQYGVWDTARPGLDSQDVT
ncbi:hypothetical protein MEBOL_000662 [Melittangium boletus DSM 14713]|uniref:Uncharacterized protein n=1 Tax=Melittangium boletus DSM 14713 TaxID=1294270 RepID=A0A250I5V2_9BACT|nr:hypothetical protein MEBOL_000662 [Melittangium boletus DSM 14713]